MVVRVCSKRYASAFQTYRLLDHVVVLQVVGKTGSVVKFVLAVYRLDEGWSWKPVNFRVSSHAHNVPARFAGGRFGQLHQRNQPQIGAQYDNRFTALCLPWKSGAFMGYS